MYTKTDTLLCVKNMSLKFGDNLVLRDINFTVDDIVNEGSVTGQIKTLVGKSGAGKTQTMKCLAGLQKPTSGEILIGRDQKPVKPGIVGMVLQTYPLFEHYSLLDNLKLVSNDRAKIDYYLQEFDIWDHQNKWTCELSGGQRQRTAIVQQLLCSDNFILLDEPFSGLDPVATEKLCNNIQKVANMNEQNTVIISSHILEPSLAISDSVLILGHEYTEEFVSAEQINKRVKIPGAKILHEIDLAAQGLAWRPDIRTDPGFTNMVEHVRNIFKTI